MIKACWFCKYFNYSNSHPDYSELTPGEKFEIYCSKNKWEFDSFETSQEQFGEILSTAENCPDYNTEPKYSASDEPFYT